MDQRLFYTSILLALVLLLLLCASVAMRSRKEIRKYVALLDLSLIPPMVGNMIIVGSSIRARSLIGCYSYFIGMDLVMFALVLFTNAYCRGVNSGSGKQHKPTLVYLLLLADAVQLCLNPIFGHAFSVESVEVQGRPYYRLVPGVGQIIHRVVDYLVAFAVILIFILAVIKTTRINRERYMVILVSIIVVAVWETFYIFSRTPIDRSMIGFGLIGISSFYFSIIYRPLRLLDRMLSDIASDLSQALFVFDPEGKCIWANQPGLRLAKVDADRLDGVNESLERTFGSLDREEKDWVQSIVIGFGDDASYFLLQRRSISDDRNRMAGSFLSVLDNTEEQQRIKRELYNSTHDSLTGMYTKQHFFEKVRQKIDAGDGRKYLAVFVDVKNFKIVNDIFGSDFGDKALQQLADHIRSFMTYRCVYGRLAGDTFGVFVPADEFDSAAIESSLAAFSVTDGVLEHHILVNLGVYEVTEPSLDVSVMFDRAHLALSVVGDEYKTHIAYYDSKLREMVMWDQQISASLHGAIESMQIMPYLQPIADSQGRVVGAEALARWIHPEHGFLPPYKFIPVFEKNGMILDVDRHMWRCACKILSQWQGSHDDMFISVNISPKDFYFTDVVEEITGLVREYGIRPEVLRVEITETVFMSDAVEKMNILARLREAGFVVEMDDFGSGYSSLSLLKDMPVDVLKIDMRFLSYTNDGGRAATIVKHIIQLSDDLGIDSLTEGVETGTQYEKLAEMGCKLFQGYYFAKPMPVSEFEGFAFGTDG
ncbi:diguanylate cyclase (GGDEF) domain-containing protein [Ruminococcus sp. YE71]|uniref:putative bifunctional diguanylate cyclase/phosphodiesterase n=1 Tax=unclassified Ruminococcus TaxID=2608920 RepID=UPI0008904646|nr:MULTISPECIES: EAL domain-containing protein [unclassified Ruminococcus]SDA17331.1 diguanylate cyclase (GGDEF) domain-containing protein [Ruminococcus sp. YE78]SFW26663.1 diguanylate cyclase (GGDEF) domain-containing protein [Ruminococcus sp. YE71]